MEAPDLDRTLERYAQEYANDPEFIAEGLAVKVTEQLAVLLEEKGLTQSWLAQQMGVSRAHVSRILNAPPNMTLLTIARIAVALGVKPEVLLNAEPTEFPAGRNTATHLKPKSSTASAAAVR